MKQCPNPECPHRQRIGAAAEFHDGISICSDCGAPLESVADIESSTAPAAVAAPTPPALLRRLGVTLLAPLVLLVGGLIPLPGLDPDQVESLADGSRSLLDVRLSVVSLGIQPLLTAYLIVELAAVVVPRWRPLRHGGFEGRGKLERATAVIALLLAGFQAYGLAQLAEVSGLSEHPGTGTKVVMTATLMAGMSCLILAARWIGRHGLVNGFAALFGASLLRVELGELVRRLDPSGPDPLGPFDLTLIGVGVAVVAGATLRALGIRWEGGRRGSKSVAASLDAARAEEARLDYRTRASLGGPGASSLPLPASGIGPLEAAASLLALPATFASMDLPTGGLASALLGADVYWPTYAAVVAAVAALFAFLFNDPARVAALWARRDAPKAHPDIAALERAARRELRRAIARTLGLLAVIAGVAHVVRGLAGWLPSATTIALAAAIGADLVAEWRARLRFVGLVAVWPEHRPYALGPALDALAAAGIPVHARGANHRTLLQLAGPWVPIELLVPPEHAEEATKILAHLLHSTPGAIDARGSGPEPTPV